MKRSIVKFLCWLLFKIDRHRLIQNQFIGKGSFSICWEKYIPEDGMWHPVNINFSVWMLANKPEVLSKDERAEIYVDGAVITEAGEKKGDGK